ncbi:DUF2795 domain-containing protein [Patescibacteria group bacterium]|nr:DUF2795 domain-containing protein [Patescibacteria group bacterium]
MDIQSMLKGIKFPINKQGLMQFIKDKKAPSEAMTMINGLPNREFTSIDDLTGELDM